MRTDGDGRTLAELRAERQRLEAIGADTTLIARAERLAAARIAWEARHNPPPEITSHLPPRPDAPHLRRRWETAVATVAVYRARWRAEQGPGAGGELLGPIPTDPDQLRHRYDAVRHLMNAIAADVEVLPTRAHSTRGLGRSVI